MPNNNLVSIVIPCYRGAHFLSEAIESCLKQTHKDIEVIVVDDASPDNCGEIADSYSRRDSRVRVVRRPVNGGVALAFNTGFDRARGQFFTRLAQDDVFADDAIEQMTRALEQRPDAGLVYCDYYRMTVDGKITATVRVPPPNVVLSWRNRVGLCVMWPRKVWEELGGFDPAFDTAEDYEYWLRISARYPLLKCALARPLMSMRHHENMGSLCAAAQQEEAGVRIVQKLYRRFSPMRRRIYRRKALSFIAVSAASDYKVQGRRWLAIRRILRSFLLWPLPFGSQELKSSFPRTKLLISLFALVLARKNTKRFRN